MSISVCATGHRPEKLGGYDPQNPLRDRLRYLMQGRLVQLEPARAVSGMALGWDQDFATVCIALSIPFVAALPFAGQCARWPPESRRFYDVLLAKAAEIVTVCTLEEGERITNSWVSAAMQRRNEYMVDVIGDRGVVLAGWDGSPGGTANCIWYAKRLGRMIVRIDPAEVAMSL